jgi:hypothetical protein
MKVSTYTQERNLKLYSSLSIEKICEAAKPYAGMFVDHIKTEASYHYLVIRYEDMEEYEAFLIRLGMEIQAMISA